MISVGLTGGIGSGKSMVAKLFALLDVPVYDSDERAKVLMNSDSVLIQNIKELLGKESYTSKGLNNAFIAQRIFSDINLRDSLNKLVHSSVFKDYDAYKERQFDASYVIQESAILFEGGYEKIHNIMISVSSPPEMKINRLKARGLSEKDILKRMESQWSDEKKVEKSDFVIINDEKESLISQVLNLHNKILASYL